MSGTGEVGEVITPVDAGPDGRQSAILRAVVEEYIRTAKPVGSGTVANAPQIDVSAATVRNEMATLENEGYLVSPHTSAGRIPTDKGYRLFVDGLMQDEPAELGAVQSAKVDEFFATTHGEIERMLRDTSRLLSSVTNHAAMVLTEDTPTPAEVASVQLVGLSDDVALAVFVMSDGSVDKVSFDRSRTMTDPVLENACMHLRAEMDGRAIGTAPQNQVSEGLPDHNAVASVVDEVRQAIGQADRHGDLELFVGGTSKMADDFEAIETVREVLAILEQQLVVVSLVRDVLGRGRQVAIGTETGVDPLAECALVLAPYHVDGEKIGSIGVLGPTRMDYGQALAAVAIVSRGLGDRLTSG